jgi:hypothetical protein
LIDHEEFVKNHPALQAYLQEHPGVREVIKENPNSFMQQEARYDPREHGMKHAVTYKQFDSFGEFLGSHSNIAEQLSQDPTLVKNQEYMENHPELQEYLNGHPDVRQQLMENPQTFVKSAQQFSKTGTDGRAVTTPMADPKPKY